MNAIKKNTAYGAIFLTCGMLLAAFTPVNAWFGRKEAPAAAAFSKSDVTGQLITFSQEDFTGRITGKEDLSAIVVSALPEGGSLRLAGQTVRQGEAIPTEQLAALCFVPDAGEEIHTSFTFFPVFSRSGAGDQSVTVHLNVSDAPNACPIAVQQSFETYADLPLNGALKAVDPDGDPCTFTVVSQGKRGTAEITEAGFRYTPSGSWGKDSFTVEAVDCYGNRSQPAEITVKVVKRAARETFTYTDLADSPVHYAALRLREAGVFSGESFGSESFFHPEQPVSRAEFLAMTASIAQLAQPVSAVSTGLSDNAAIPAWAQGYVAAGILSGVVNGSDDGSGNREFRADIPITRAEAAAILDRCLSLADDGRSMSFADREEVPAWAAQSVVNTSAAGLLPVFSDNTIRSQAAVTRQDAALMLYEMMQYSANERK